jgi:cell division cycle protein 20 (cofactor of APC complex)
MGSQVCSLNWNVHQREIVSAHGYMDNQLTVWKYPDMTKIQELKEHSERVLSTAVSPDGNSIVSAGADQQLAFWQINNVKPTLIANRDVLLGAPTIR